MVAGVQTMKIAGAAEGTSVEDGVCVVDTSERLAASWTV